VVSSLDSNVPHGLGDGQYEIRVKECAEAVAALQIKFPNIKKLRSVSGMVQGNN
jgi:galactokinase